MIREWTQLAVCVQGGTAIKPGEMIEEDPPDLVISDIKMPEMDGLTLLMLLRDKHPNLPVLALSGYVDAEIIDNYPFNGFIQKPAQLEVIRRAVDTALSTRQA